MKFRITTLVLACIALFCSCGTAPEAVEKEISYTELRSKIAGAWLGQMVGNIYGLEYENKFIEEPGEGPFVWNKAMRKMTAVDGAFSDDDTDVEYMYLIMMEKNGVRPTYSQMRECWMYHIRDRVWLANRAALGAMHYGLTPPFTGAVANNPHWFQIDPQLINEIWAYTAPGMVEYAAGISDWAARVTSDSWATSPTVVYGAMYAGAFFESDIRKLMEDALECLPEGDRFAETVRECIRMYDADPTDWHAARAFIETKYYENENSFSKTIWNANLNGAMGMLALLYGGGDIEKTLNIGCALGFDADNQTATTCGILGVINGGESVPTSYSMPFGHWTKPFNDRYINVTRHDLPDASIEDIIDRTVAIAVKVVEENGGRTEVRDGEKYLIVNTSAKFNPPLEFCVGPQPRLVLGEKTDYDFSCATNRDCKWKLVGGTLPQGLRFDNGRLTGVPAKVGEYNIRLSLSDGIQTIEKDFNLVVRGRNIAPSGKIVSSVEKTDFEVLDSCWLTNSRAWYAEDVSVINDGVLTGAHSVFCSLNGKSNATRRDWFGFVWDQPQRFDKLSFRYGCLEEFGGWYSDMAVEILDEDGNWIPVRTDVSPALPESDIVFIQPHNAEYLFSFRPVISKGVRVIGDDHVEHHWHKYTKNVSSFINVSEIEVYEAPKPEYTVDLTAEELRDKIEGGWAGQTIGVVYGAPTEFKHQGTLIPDSQPISWGEGYVKHWWDRKPGLFDDIYNDLTFAEAFDQLGLDCSASELAIRFATADYHLAHANQAGRYNVRQGIMPPASGHWLNNPHADDLDFQIEADFIGLMSPGMIPQALEIAETVGHIMNSGDGFYGGAFVAGLYSAAFIYDSPSEILDAALLGIPEQSTFYQCVDDVRKLHSEYPSDWKQCWFEIQKKWGADTGCPKGVFLSFDIDAKLNSAYVAIGLLYGGGDFARSMEIATRCGQDSDCNPATVGGVLGVMYGKKSIPDFWKQPLEEIWNLDFEGTDISLAKGCDMSYRHALELIAANGGKVDGTNLAIPQYPVHKLPLEQNFTGTYPVFRDQKDAWMEKEYEFDFSGNGFCIWGNLVCLRGISRDYADRVSKKHVGSEVFAMAEQQDDYVAEIEVWIDGELDQVSILPMKGTSRKLEPAWKYQMQEGRHHVRMVWRNPRPDTYLLRINAIQYYSENPVTNPYYHN
ncbi:MAG: ADP-ribosylglycohydrolase family protein [Candidatus Cryptobacteroides sp.]